MWKPETHVSIYSLLKVAARTFVASGDVNVASGFSVGPKGYFIHSSMSLPV